MDKLALVRIMEISAHKLSQSRVSRLLA